MHAEWDPGSCYQRSCSAKKVQDYNIILLHLLDFTLFKRLQTCIAKCDGWKITPSQMRGENSNPKPNPKKETSAYTYPYVKKRWFMPRLRGKHRDVDQN